MYANNHKVILSDIDKSIYVNAIYDLGHNVADSLKLPKDISISVVSEISKKAEFRKGHNTDQAQSSVSTSKMILEYNVKVNKELQKGRTFQEFKTRKPIIIDSDKYMVTEDNTLFTITGTIRIMDKNRTVVANIENTLLEMAIQDTFTITVNTDIFYYLPLSIVALIKNSFQARNKIEPIELLDYINYISTGYVDIATNASGDADTLSLVVKRAMLTEAKIDEGSFDMDIEYDADTGFYTKNIDYSFEIKAPTALTISNEVVIYNEMVSSYLINKQPSIENYTNDTGIEALNVFNIDYIKFFKLMDMYNTRYLTIPLEDRHLPYKPLANRRPLFSVLTLLDIEDTQKALFNIRDLVDYRIDPVLLEYLRKNRNYINLDRYSLFNFNLFENDRELPLSSLIIDNELNIIPTMPLNPTKCYRVLFTLNTQLQYLPYGEQSIIKRYKRLLDKRTVLIKTTLSKSLNILRSRGLEQYIKGIDEIINESSYMSQHIEYDGDVAILENTIKRLRSSDVGDTFRKDVLDTLYNFKLGRYTQVDGYVLFENNKAKLMFNNETLIYEYANHAIVTMGDDIILLDTAKNMYMINDKELIVIRPDIIYYQETILYPVASMIELNNYSDKAIEKTVNESKTLVRRI